MKFLFIGLVWPEPTSSAAGWRIQHLLEALVGVGHDVVLASASTRTSYSLDLEESNIVMQQIQLNDASFDKWIVDYRPDVVVFDRFISEEQYGWRIREHCPECLHILDTEDIQGLRKARQMAFRKGGDVNDYLINDTTLREIASIFRCDLSLIISEVEIEYLVREYRIPESILYYLPLTVHKSELKNNQPSFDDREHMVFIGSFLHEPNRDAIHLLQSQIWPVMAKRIPHAELHIYGSYSHHKSIPIYSDRMYIKPYTDDIREALKNYRLNLAYLPYGAGLKGKIIDAMACQTPTVMNQVAAEGFFKADTIGGIVVDGIEEFTDAAVSLYHDEKLWKSSSAVCHEILSSRFLFEKNMPSFLEKILQLKNSLFAHRQANKLSQVFWHQTLQSTKYLSKWIEEKNIKANPQTSA